MEIKCTLCGEVKDCSEFYKNKLMPSGYANQCKKCVKSRAKKREEELRKNPEFVEIEKLRSKEKYYRLNYKEKQYEIDKDKPWKAISIYKNQNRNLRNQGVITNNEVVHHWNYNLLDDYFIMSKANHRKIHKYLFFDKKSLCFKTLSNQLLATREEHENYINFYSN